MVTGSPPDEVRERTDEELRKAQQQRVHQEGNANPRLVLQSRPMLIAASLIGLAVLGAFGVWFIRASPPSLPAPVPPAVVGAAPTQTKVTPLSSERERVLKPGDTFQECNNCPEMVVVPAGTFTMGSRSGELGRTADEGPQHAVTFAQQFAVGRFELTFDEWDACVADNGCNGYKAESEGWGRGRRPAINVSWNDAKAYVTWLAKKTGKSYRLLSEAEREYVTRAGTNTPFWWGNSISTSQANYDGKPYGVRTNGENRGRTVPADSFAPNPWGFYQVHGNIYEWTEDCWNDNYNGAPVDGSAWISGDCSRRTIRGVLGTTIPSTSAPRADWDMRSTPETFGSASELAARFSYPDYLPLIGPGAKLLVVFLEAQPAMIITGRRCID